MSDSIKMCRRCGQAEATAPFEESCAFCYEAGQELAALAAEREEERRRRNHLMAYMKISGQLGKMFSSIRRHGDSRPDLAIRHLHKIRKIADGVEFDADELEWLTDDLARMRSRLAGDGHAKLRALLGLIEVQILGTVTVDWDAELRSLEGRP